MSKKKTNLKVAVTETTKSKGRIFNAPSRTGAASHLTSSATSDVVEQKMALSAIAGQVFSSEEQALETLLSNVVGRFSDDPSERADMADFLEMILDTDPGLREEILAGTTIRK
jgi:hypothetical protein